MCTLGSEADAQRIDGIRADISTDEDANGNGSSTTYERFYLQYFFPPSSVGECGRVGPAGVRMTVRATHVPYLYVRIMFVSSVLFIAGGIGAEIPRA